MQKLIARTVYFTYDLGFTHSDWIMPIFFAVNLIGAFVNPLLYTSSGVTVMLSMYVIAYAEADNQGAKRNEIF